MRGREGGRGGDEALVHLATGDSEFDDGSVFGEDEAGGGGGGGGGREGGRDGGEEGAVGGGFVEGGGDELDVGGGGREGGRGGGRSEEEDGETVRGRRASEGVKGRSTVRV